MKKLILFLFGALCATSLWAQQTIIPYTATARVVPNHSEPLVASEYGGATYNDAASTYDAATQQGTIVFDGTVTKIKANAFDHNNTLLSMVLPDGLTHIGASAFGECRSLQTINIPDGVTTIDFRAFFWCVNLNDVILPSSLESLGASVFQSCHSIHSITIPEKITVIPKALFLSCKSLANIEFLSTVVSIESQAFSDIAITSFTVPEGITTIPTACFSSCSKLQSVSLPSTLKVLEQRAFTHCYALTSITLPAGLTSIDREAFNSCHSLKSLDIPEGITTLTPYLCSMDTSLTSVHIPSTVTSIQSYVFRNCKSLKEITIDAVTPPSLGADVFLEVPTDAMIEVPAGSKAAYQAAWPNFTNIHDATESYALTFHSTEEAKGKAYGPATAHPLEHVRVYAIPADGAKFVSWTDGDTTNPRIITVKQDSTFTATFGDEFSQPTEPGVRMKVTTKDEKVYEFDTKNIENTEFYRVEE